MTERQIICGNALTELPKLPAESAQCFVSSPPYWGLRDYNLPATFWPAGIYWPLPGAAPVDYPEWTGCLGLEPDLAMYVGHVVAVMREVRRVLRPDGTAWVNLGDSYAQDGGPGWQGKNGDRADRRFRLVRDTVPMRAATRVPPSGLKPKDMLGIPWRVAFALQADGWWLRSEVIWSKPSPMPESITDRPTKSHEQVFFLSKSEVYFYNTAAAREPCTGNAHPRGNGVNNKAKDIPDGWQTGAGSHKPIEHAKPGRVVPRSKQNASFSGAVTDLVEDRNWRDVWNIAAEPCIENHFATFPSDLARRCIIAGSLPGHTVIDCFSGTGKVGEIAQECGRHALLIELSKEYVDIIRARTAQTGMVLT